MTTLDKVPIKIKVAAKELRKFFNTGESVRILQGVHAGEPGVVLAVSAEQTHANVLMENTKADLKVLVNNLRLSDAVESNARDSLADFLNPQRNVPKSISERAARKTDEKART